MRRIVEEESPQLNIDPDSMNAMLKQRTMPLAAMIAALDTQYGAIADFLSDLTPIQLAREATSPALRNTPLGERRSLDQWADHLVDEHLRAHVTQIGAACKAIGMPADR